jgi:hypothetical protein
MIPAGLAEALPAIEVTAMTGTAGPSWRERAEAKKAAITAGHGDRQVGAAEDLGDDVSALPLDRRAAIPPRASCS